MYYNLAKEENFGGSMTIDKMVEPVKDKISHILISVCTCMRPKMLKNALLSIEKLIVPDDIKIEILVVDNDKNQSAKSIVEEIAPKLNLKVNYFVEEKRGISNARNRVLDEATILGASHILFFDDDELLTPNVLVEHIKMYNNTNWAHIISGPTPNKFDDNCPDYIKKHMVFKQKTTKKTGLKRKSCASGNVFFPLSIYKKHLIKFDSEYVFIGGEDGDFFSKAQKVGYNIVWCNEAIIEEIIPPARANLNYIFKKCYYNGYASSFSKFKEKNDKIKKILYTLKTIITLLLNIMLVVFSLLLGKIIFYNSMGTTIKTFGKIIGCLNSKPYNFYANIYGE